MTAIDIPALRAAQPISAVIGQSLKLKRAGREFVACCPFHSERSASFTVNDDKDFAHCFGCGWHGDALDFVQRAFGLSLREAAERIGAGSFPVLPIRTAPAGVDRNTIAEARAIWRAAGPAAGTPVATYLSGRGLWLPIPETIRFARLRYGKHGDLMPCLVALITGADGKLLGVQRTYLKADGTRKADVPKAKLSLGRVSGGAIRLAPPAAEVAVCEGLEDALTLQQELRRTAWASAGASMMPAMLFPPSVRSVVIGRDNDAAGERSATAAAAEFGAAGLGVRVMTPADGFKDFNAQLQGVRA